MYVQIQSKATMEQVSARIKKAMWDNVDAETKKFIPEIFLFRMKRWHLYSEWKYRMNVGGRIQYVWLFGIIRPLCVAGLHQLH
jgi:hypothetical protein